MLLLMKASEAGNTQGTQCGCVSVNKHAPYIRKELHTEVVTVTLLLLALQAFLFWVDAWRGETGLLTDGKETSGHWRSLRDTGDVVVVEGAEAEAAGQPSESAVNSHPLGAPGRLAASEPTRAPLPQGREGPSCKSRSVAASHTQLRSSNALGRGLGKDRDALDVGWNQKSVPFSCGTLGELFSFFWGLHFYTSKMERERAI